MNQRLLRVPLRIKGMNPQHLADIAAFSCGDEPHCDYLNWWIKAHESQLNSAKYLLENGPSTFRAWLYYDRSEPAQLVGYGSIMNVQYTWFSGWEFHGLAAEFPALALNKKFKKQKFGEKSYATHILHDLIVETNKRINNGEIEPVILLWVDPINTEARVFYDKKGFIKLEDQTYEEDGIHYEAWYSKIIPPESEPPTLSAESHAILP
ncbi:MAG: hypothetical protein U0796_10135 [Gemmatales bacterium]